MKTKPIIAIAFIILITVSLAPIGFSIVKPVAATENTFKINNNATYTNSTNVTITFLFDPAANITQVRLGNDGAAWADWQNYTTDSVGWNLTDGDGQKTVNLQFRDGWDQIASASKSIILDTTPPTPYPYVELASTTSIFFDASGSSDNIGVANCTWDFGDGNQTNSISGTHTYPSIANYTGNLTVQDFAGNNATQTFTIRLPTSTPTATAHPTTQPTDQPTVTWPPTHTASPTPTSENAPSDATLQVVIIIAVAAAVAIAVAAVIIKVRR